MLEAARGGGKADAEDRLADRRRRGRAPGRASRPGKPRPWAMGHVGRIGSAQSDGLRQIFLQDPDGYWLEVNGTLPVGYPE